MTRAALYTSGHPHCFWPHACQAVCFNDGVDHSRGESAWFKMHGREFDGIVLPFGCAVYIKELGTREQSKRPQEKQRKWDPRGILAVFAGYSLAPGDRFDAYYAWPLEVFVGKDLQLRASYRDFANMAEPFKVRSLKLPRGPIVFPLKAHYTFMNDTLTGREMASGRLECVAPPVPPLGEGIAGLEEDDEEPSHRAGESESSDSSAGGNTMEMDDDFDSEIGAPPGG